MQSSRKESWNSAAPAHSGPAANAAPAATAATADSTVSRLGVIERALPSRATSGAASGSITKTVQTASRSLTGSVGGAPTGGSAPAEAAARLGDAHEQPGEVEDHRARHAVEHV